MSDTARQTLDARWLLCPLPVIRTQDRVAGLADGAELEVLCTDPGALQDIPAWCRVHGHAFLGSSRDGHEVRIRLRVVRGATGGASGGTGHTASRVQAGTGA
jgi:tRNA 2-thiouridine synthesizing protein A